MNYFITKFYCRDSDDIENIIKKRFGNNTFICDFYELTPEIIMYLDRKYNLNEHGISHAIVKYKGNLKKQGRQYFAEVHRKQGVLTGWLAYGRFTMPNYYLDIGSWIGLYMPVIVVKIKEKPMKLDFDSICPICLVSIENNDLNNIKYCKYGCGNCYHSACYLMLSNKCGICRSKLEH